MPAPTRRAVPTTVLLTLAAGEAARTAVRALRRDWDRPTPSGPRLTREDQPELFALIDGVTAAAGDPLLDEVYLDPDANATVMLELDDDGREVSVLLFGLPLLGILDDEMLRAVLAHELSHLRDERRWPARLDRSRRRAVRRARAWLAPHVEDGPLAAPRRARAAVRGARQRRRERAADALAIRLTCPEAQRRSLLAMEQAWQLFPEYMDHTVEPALDGRVHPPIAEGMARYLHGSAVAGEVDRAVRRELERPAKAGATHPTLGRRLAAAGPGDGSLRPDRAPGARDGRPPVLRRLRDVAALERGLIRDPGGMRSVDWEDVGEAAELPRLRERVRVAADLLDGLQVRDAGAIAADLEHSAPFARATAGAAERPEDAAEMMHLLIAAVAVAVAGSGWTLHALPGEPYTLVDGLRRFAPSPMLYALLDGDESAETWEATCAALGIAGLPLAPAAEAPLCEDGSEAARAATADQSLAGTGR